MIIYVRFLFTTNDIMMPANIESINRLYKDIIATSKFIECRARTYMEQVEFVASQLCQVKETKEMGTQTDSQTQNVSPDIIKPVHSVLGTKCPVGFKPCPKCASYQKVAKKCCPGCNHMFYSKRLKRIKVVTGSIVSSIDPTIGGSIAL